MPMHHLLPSGARVRLRLPVRADTESLRALVGDEETARLLRFDPRRRAVICALDFEEVVGVGTIELCDGGRGQVVAYDDEVAALLERELAGRASRVRSAPSRRRRGLRRIGRRP
jgi:hypothetical protein